MIVNSHTTGIASNWVQRWSHLVRPGGLVLDVACGQGRHLRWFADRNHPVVGVDMAQTALDSVDDLVANGQAQTVAADIENGPWPFLIDSRAQEFEAVVVSNYLWRALFPILLNSLAPGGVLLYETFSAGNETVGKPSRADFLLQSGELLHICRDLRVVAYEDGFLDTPQRYVQRIAAVRPTAQTMDKTHQIEAPRYPL